MTPARALSLGLLLTATAGFSDGLGFLALGGFYTSFMSGNTTQLGVAVASGTATAALLSGGLVILFFVGSYLGALAATATRSKGPALSLTVVVAAICVCLVLNLTGYRPEQSLLALALAAGAQNAVLQPLGAARLGATFVTGTLFAAGQDLARATRGRAPPLRWLQHLLVWAALAIGAWIGALAYDRWQVAALLAPLAIYAACLAWFLARATPRNV